MVFTDSNDGPDFPQNSPMTQLYNGSDNGLFLMATVRLLYQTETERRDQVYQVYITTTFWKEFISKAP